jgi:hypothetical protein
VCRDEWEFDDRPALLGAKDRAKLRSRESFKPLETAVLPWAYVIPAVVLAGGLELAACAVGLGTSSWASVDLPPAGSLQLQVGLWSISCVGGGGGGGHRCRQPAAGAGVWQFETNATTLANDPRLWPPVSNEPTLPTVYAYGRLCEDPARTLAGVGAAASPPPYMYMPRGGAAARAHWLEAVCGGGRVRVLQALVVLAALCGLSTLVSMTGGGGSNDELMPPVALSRALGAMLCAAAAAVGASLRALQAAPGLFLPPAAQARSSNTGHAVALLSLSAAASAGAAWLALYQIRDGGGSMGQLVVAVACGGRARRRQERAESLRRLRGAGGDSDDPRARPSGGPKAVFRARDAAEAQPQGRYIPTSAQSNQAVANLATAQAREAMAEKMQEIKKRQRQRAVEMAAAREAQGAGGGVTKILPVGTAGSSGGGGGAQQTAVGPASPPSPEQRPWVLQVTEV